MAWAVKYSWHEPVGSFSTKKAAQEYAKLMRAAGNHPVKVIRVNPSKKRRKKKKSATKRIGAALTRFLKRQNPAKMKGVTRVRVRKLKGGGISIKPAR
jgi:hypothetical protein